MSVVGRVQINRPGATGPVNPPTEFEDPPPEPVDPESYLALLIADGATAAWPLDEEDGTDTYVDLIGSLAAVLNQGTTSGYSSTPIGPSSTSSPHIPGLGAVDNAATAIAIVTEHSDSFEVGTGDFAIEVWVQHDAMGPTFTAGIFGALVLSDISKYVFGHLAGPLLGADSGKIRMTDTANVSAISSGLFDDQALHHCVFTRRSGSYYVIVDGNEVGSATPGAEVDFLGSNLQLHFAAIDYGSVLPGYTAYTLSGQLSWCAWYPVGLTAEQAMTHYVAGGGI